ncbi:GIN domain-containing protein [Aureivirga marina]|uniref:GIN domain-containing protein n=1 Tax=Aureivirga marina TaxID=1182451 RepID=UPI0018C9AABF|nr:DUF2807 domain-containing protein [Aureivirga marina]
MTKNIYFLFLITLFSSCAAEDIGECFYNSSDIREYDFDLTSFDEVIVNENISLEVKFGFEKKLIVKTSENRIENFTHFIEDGKLVLNMEETCNLTRNLKATNITLITDHLTKIENNTQYKIYSTQILFFPNLTLSTLEEGNSGLAVGTFDLKVNCLSLNIFGVEFADFSIEGRTENLNIAFFSGAPFLDGKNLISKNTSIRQESTNDILLHPIDKISGTIHSLGNIILYNTPEEIDILELYKGKVIINN